MTLASLQALTWTTVSGAVASALLLASLESRAPEWTRMKRADAPVRSLPVAVDAKGHAAPRITTVSETPRRETVAR